MGGGSEPRRSTVKPWASVGTPVATLSVRRTTRWTPMPEFMDIRFGTKSGDPPAHPHELRT